MSETANEVVFENQSNDRITYLLGITKAADYFQDKKTEVPPEVKVSARELLFETVEALRDYVGCRDKDRPTTPRIDLGVDTDDTVRRLLND